FGLATICQANSLNQQREPVYFDEGIFSSTRAARQLSEQTSAARYCDVLAEQDSRYIKGLQLADLVAHTCATMLLDALGLLPKLVKAGPNSGYDADLDIELAFELWAGVRYQFFNGGIPSGIQS